MSQNIPMLHGSSRQNLQHRPPSMQIFAYTFSRRASCFQMSYQNISFSRKDAGWVNRHSWILFRKLPNALSILCKEREWIIQMVLEHSYRTAAGGGQKRKAERRISLILTLPHFFSDLSNFLNMGNKWKWITWWR